ncbi:MAG: hypothetical protein KAH03_04415 [Cocleimonas sp.]|nr:hypothetical protein [Cocleimonas sp.]
MKDITPDIIFSLVYEAFESAWNNRANISSNAKRSSYFVSELSGAFYSLTKQEALQGVTELVQKTESSGKKASGEWLLDIAIVSKVVASTGYKNRSTQIVDKIIWAIESEFSTNLGEFCKDFSKLLHIKSKAYLYVAGLNQTQIKSREDYIEAQTQLAIELVKQHQITEPFYMVFVPTPGQSGQYASLWDSFELDQLKSWFRVVDLSSK